MSELRVALVCRPQVASGFALAGVRAVEVADAVEANRRVATLLAEPDLGLLLLEAPFHQDLDADLRRRISSRPLPLVIQVPSPRWMTGASVADQYVIELLRRAIGYQVRLR